MQRPARGHVRLKFLRNFGGYTIIEVMIFLVISSALLASAFTVTRGQEAHTEFSSSMNNVNSKMQQWIDEVVNGFSNSPAQASTSDYTCTASGIAGQPRLTKNVGIGNSRGANSDCVFLGTAVFATNKAPDNDKLIAYTIIGRRTTGLDNATVNTLADAKPVAVTNPPNDTDLTEEFKIPNGAVVLSVKSDSPAPSNQSHLAGFYSSLNKGGGNGASSLSAFQYPYSSDDKIGVPNCINFLSPCSLTGTDTQPPPMKTWRICFGSLRNSDKAVLMVNSSSGLGATARLDFSEGAKAASC